MEKKVCQCNVEDGCVVDWGGRNYCCENLEGVVADGKFYPVESEEFQEVDDIISLADSICWVCKILWNHKY